MRPESKWAVAVAGLVLGGALAYWRWPTPAPPHEPVEREATEPPAPEEEPPEDLEPEDEPDPAVSPRAAPSAPASAAPSREGFSKPESEEAFVRELQRLRQTDKARALALARKGDEWYGDSGPSAEPRKAMMVTLLVDLGGMQNMEEARALTRRFIQAYPESPYRPLIQGVTGIHPRPGKPEGLE